MIASLPFLTSTQVLRLLRENTITVEAYAASLLERIKERDGIVKAWTYLGELPFLSAAADVAQCILISLLCRPRICPHAGSSPR
jgi:hypothetical protein